MTNQVSLSALADPTRRRIFESLRAGPRSVTEIARGLPVSRPAVSQHLRVLSEAGLVTAEQRGTRRIYSVRAEGVEELRAYFDEFWTTALAGLKAAAERGER